MIVALGEMNVRVKCEPSRHKGSDWFLPHSRCASSTRRNIFGVLGVVDRAREIQKLIDGLFLLLLDYSRFGLLRQLEAVG